MWVDPKLNWAIGNSCEYTDLNRIESNTQELANVLSALQFNIPALVFVSNRDTSRIDKLSDINRIESNIEAIRYSFLTPPGYEGAKTWAIGIGFTYLDALRLENNLKRLYDLFQIAESNLRFCGTFACGEEGVIW